MAAVKKAFTKTPGPASKIIFPNSFLKICQLILNAESKINAGKNIKAINF